MLLYLVAASLTPDTEYHYRIVATNANGTSNGADVVFRTIALPESVTGSATSVTGYAATLNGTVDPNGDATTYYFEYGTDTNYGTQVPATPGSVGSGWEPVALSANITGLSAGIEYHFRIVGSNSVGSDNGSDATFTTVGQLIWNTHNWNEAPWGP